MFSLLLLRLPEIHEVLQLPVCDALVADGRWNALAQLVSLENLTPAADERLGRIDEPEVRLAWLARPGRAPEEILAALADEDRPEVLESVLWHRDFAPEAYTAVARQLVGTRACWLVLRSAHAGDDAWALTARAVAEALNTGTAEEVLAGTQDVVYSLGGRLAAQQAFAEAARSPRALAVAAQLGELGKSAADQVTRELVRELGALAQAVPVAAARVEDRDTVTMTSATLAWAVEDAHRQPWCTDARGARLRSAITEVRSALSQAGAGDAEGAWGQEMVETWGRLVHRSPATGRIRVRVQALCAQVARASTAAAIETVCQELDELREQLTGQVPDPLAHGLYEVYAAVLCSPHASATRRYACVHQLHREQLWCLPEERAFGVAEWCDHITQSVPEAMAAFTVSRSRYEDDETLRWCREAPSALGEAEFTRYVTTYLGLIPELGEGSRWRAVRALFELDGALECAIATIPVRELEWLLLLGEDDGELQRRYVRDIERRLTASSPLTLACMELVGPAFPGTLDELVATCAAALR